MAWNVQGTWRVEGQPKALLAADAIAPGALLEPTAEDSGHSITVLLPDGQSVLYQCFTAKDCARGFRVPALFRPVDPFAVNMLARIRATLVRERSQPSDQQPNEMHIAHDEMVATLGPGNRVTLGGLAARLSNGEYFVDLKSLDGRSPEQSAIPLEKSAGPLQLTVPGPGLYLLTITDSRKWPRINLMLAVASAQDNSVATTFQKEHALLAMWTHHDFFGWPLHDFQRAYLKSLMLHIPPAPEHAKHAETSKSALAGATAEPTFSPRPKMVSGDLDIALKCATPGAVIHYVLGPAQPMESSPVYRAPIVMKGLPMTIKAFASAPGKKDSPVVTGNFGVEGDD